MRMRLESSVAMFQGFLPTSVETRAHVWKFSWQYAGRRPRHFHAEPEINLIVAGSATFGIGEYTIAVSAGELLGFAPGQDHVLLDASPDFFLFAIGVDPRLSAEVLRAERASAFLPLHLRLTHDDFTALASRSEAIVDRSGIDQSGAELWEQANWLRSRGVERQSTCMHVLTRRTLGLIADPPDLGRDALARTLRASPTAISRYFHQDVGMTLVKYRTRLRLLRFIGLVDHGKDNLVSAAKAAGFGSYSQCHRAFQAQLACSPRQFFYSDLRQRMQLRYEP